MNNRSRLFGPHDDGQPSYQKQHGWEQKIYNNEVCSPDNLGNIYGCLPFRLEPETC